jgi:hypothetical protein
MRLLLRCHLFISLVRQVVMMLMVMVLIIINMIEWNAIGSHDMIDGKWQRTASTILAVAVFWHFCL